MATKTEETKKAPEQPMSAEQKQALALRRQSTPVGIVPQNVDEAWRMAGYLAKAENIVPKELINRPETIMGIILYGAEVGVKPMAALKNISMINGRASIWGDLALAIIMSHPDYEDHREWDEGKPMEDDWTFHCEIKRKGKAPIVRKFSVADAKRAHLWMKKGREGGETPWVTYPQRMLQMRSRSWALRDRFPDALAGLSIAEEAMDMDPIQHPTQPEAEIIMPRRVEVETRPDTPQAVEVKPEVQVASHAVPVQDLDGNAQDQLEDDREEYVALWNDIVALDKTWRPDEDFVNMDAAGRKAKIESAKQILYELRCKAAGVKPTYAQQEPLTPKSYTQEEPLDDFDGSAEDPAPPPQPKKSEMTSAEKHLGPVDKREKPLKVLAGDYERIKAMHAQKLFVVLNSAKVHTEKDLYAKLWKSWGIESAKDIPRSEYTKVLEWVGGGKIKA